MRDTAVGDNGLLPLGDIPTLESIYVAGTNVTEQGLQSLRRANARLSIYLE
mgnify:CR=1 FL=1